MDQEPTFIEEKNHPPSNEWKKEIDSKVIYQYPKGKFRFPVIPDSPSHENRRERNRGHKIEPDKLTPQASHVEQEKQQKDQNSKSSNKQESVNKIKRPFRPTETISPIYGYNRPIKKEQISKSIEAEQDTKEYLPPAYDEHSSNSTKNLLLFDEEAAVGLELEDILSQGKQEEMSIEENEKLSFVNKENENTQNVVQSDDRQEFVFTDEVVEILAEDNRKQSLEVLPEKAEAIHADVIMHPEEASQELIEDKASLEIVQDNVVINNNDSAIGERKASSLSVINKDAERKEEVKSDEEIEHKETSTKRSSLPFNVLMLNKDRQYIQKKKLEQKKESLLIEKESSTQKNNYKNEDIDTPYYVFPSINLLTPPILGIDNEDWIQEQKGALNDTLFNFNVQAKVVNITQGPSVTRYEVQPEPGVKVSKITNLSDDLKLSLAAKDIRIEAPIPGKHTIGIEVPNYKSRPVLISEIIQSEEFNSSHSPLTVALGLDISGKPIVTDLRKMPHGLIAGATGSGKSVCINTMLVSLLYKAKPEELKLLLIDPKMVELAPYNYIPHLASPVITDVKAATAALKWAVEEMERRYELLAHSGVRDISKYNQLAEDHKRYADKLPYIVIIIDELADLMMMAPADVEEAISRIAQKARACGIHLLIATQRPSVDVITGLIKANVPTRIAFSVSSQIDSRTVIDISGAEKLLGKGDMLFLENGTSKPVRLQGTFVSDEEIDEVVQHVRKEQKPVYLFEQEELMKKVQMTDEEDELFYEACEFIIEQGGASTSSLQRRFKIGYNRAARLIDMMEKQGFISEAKGTKPRDVLITEGEFLNIQENA
ncbi:DNA translocase FtsK [Niallia sp. 03133]|uniref:DNA translocase FtsK n=1 Tax=Niallia sp. 03133 TaxID=3458060 RepID=UPI00404490A8